MGNRLIPRMKPVIYVLVLLCGAVVLSHSAYSQEEIAAVNDSAFSKHIRPTVLFPHQMHTKIPHIGECNVCHHVFQNGKRVEDEDSIGMECSECHYNEGKNTRLDLIRAYHLQCKGCHMARKAGPVLCGECHKNRKAVL